MPITSDWQLEYNGLLLGSGTVYEVRQVSGIEDLPDVRTSDTPRPSDHGMFAGNDFAAGRTVEVDLEVTGTSDVSFRTSVDALAAVTAFRQTELPLTFRLPGGVDKRIYVRPRRRALPVSLDYFFRIAPTTIQFYASDPRIYADSETSLSLSLPTSTGGLTFPIVWPISWGTATSGTAQAVNAGTFATRPVVTFTGPLTAPSIENVTTGQTFRMASTFELLAGETLVVDFDSRTVLLNGTASRYSSVASNSQWWELPPGNSDIRLGATSGSGSATVTFRSAWL